MGYNPNMDLTENAVAATHVSVSTSALQLHVDDERWSGDADVVEVSFLPVSKCHEAVSKEEASEIE